MPSRTKNGTTLPPHRRSVVTTAARPDLIALERQGLTRQMRHAHQRMAALLQEQHRAKSHRLHRARMLSVWAALLADLEARFASLPRPVSH